MVRWLADARGDHLLVEAVLQRDDIAVVGHERRQRVRSRRRCRAPSRRGRRARTRPSRSPAGIAGAGTVELLDRSGDLQAALCLIAATCSAPRSTNSTSQAGAAQIGADACRRSRRRPRSGWYRLSCPLGLSMSARVSSTATAQSAMHVVVGLLVIAAEIAVAEQRAHLLRHCSGAFGRRIDHRLLLASARHALRAASKGSSPSTRRGMRRDRSPSPWPRSSARSTSCGT